MAQEKFRVVRKVRRRRLRPGRLLATLAVLAAAIAAAWLAYGPLLRLRSVAVVGGAPALWRASGIQLRTPLWQLRLGSADEELLRRERFLATAVFARRWPDRLILTVTSRVPVAAAAGASGTLYGVDRTGRVLAALPAAAKLPVLSGLAPNLVHPYADLPRDAQAAVSLAASLHAAGFAVAEVVPGATSPQVYLPSGTEVLWPGTANTGRTLRELQAILAALKHKGAVAASIDLRLPNRPLVVLRK